MMRRDFAYGQARMQARVGERLSATGWQALEGARSFGHALDQAQATPLKRYLTGMRGCRDAHSIEAALRAEANSACIEAARWSPAPWKPAIERFSTLAVLPIANGPADDADSAEILSRWFEDWTTSMPSGRPAAAVRAFSLSAVQTLATSGREGGHPYPPRAGLERVLLRAFRAQAGSAVAIFAYLSLVFTDLERLRGALVRRLLFSPALGEEAA